MRASESASSRSDSSLPPHLHFQPSHGSLRLSLLFLGFRLIWPDLTYHSYCRLSSRRRLWRRSRPFSRHRRRATVCPSLCPSPPTWSRPWSPTCASLRGPSTLSCSRASTEGRMLLGTRSSEPVSRSTQGKERRSELSSDWKLTFSPSLSPSPWVHLYRSFQGAEEWTWVRDPG